jgi:histidyl-tRNA synthetase
MKIDTIKGFKDFTGEEAIKRAQIKKILIENFEKYGFEPAETPMVEYEEFVQGDNANDEAVSDIFKLQDKGKRKLALRYEFTFQLKRIAKGKKLPFKRYQLGEVFRDEPISANRFRQFTQCDCDVIGSSVKDEAEILSLVYDVSKELGVAIVINVNNRKLLNEILDGEKIKNKEQVMREVDKLDKLPEKQIKENLKKLGAEKVLNIFKKSEAFFKKYDAYSEIEELKKVCRIYGVKINFQPSLIRGLSYYNGSIFEVKTKNIKETIIAGGSYMFDNVQSTGISFGLDRLAMISKIEDDQEKYLVISLKQDRESIKLAQQLRKDGKIASVFYGKPSKALEYANSYWFDKVIFVGEKEIKAKKFKVKDMESGSEKVLK